MLKLEYFTTRYIYISLLYSSSLPPSRSFSFFLSLSLSLALTLADNLHAPATELFHGIVAGVPRKKEQEQGRPPEKEGAGAEETPRPPGKEQRRPPEKEGTGHRRPPRQEQRRPPAEDTAAKFTFTGQLL